MAAETPSPEAAPDPGQPTQPQPPRFSSRREWRHYEKERRRQERWQRRQRGGHGYGGLLWPVVLIVVGGVLLLQNAGILSSSVWSNLWRLWPLLLVLVGLELLFRDALYGLRGVILALLVAAIALASIVLGSGSLQSAPGAAAGGQAITLTQALKGARQADVRLNFGAGSLAVGALATGGSDLASLSYNGPGQLAPQPSYTVENGIAQLTYDLHGGRGWPGWPFGASGTPTEKILLTPELPLSLTVDGGASSNAIDLSQLKVTTLTVQTGASSTEITLPQSAGTTTAKIEGGAASVTVIVPAGVAAHIDYQGGLSSLDIAGSRFPQLSSDHGHSVYESPGYASATNKVALQIHTGVSTVTIR